EELEELEIDIEQHLGISVSMFEEMSQPALLSFVTMARGPEPRRTMPTGRISLMQSLKNAMTPLKDLHFRSFLIAVCVVAFAGSIRGPFFGPFLRKTLGMPYYWLAIFGCLGILASLLTAKQWGFLGDRFGRRPVMAVSMFWGIFLLVYPYVDKDNCYYIVTTVNFLCVAVFIGYNLTVFQMRLSQAPEGKREACAGMWGAAIGVGGYLGAVLGGTLADWFESINLSIPVWGGGEIGYMQAIIFISLGIQLCVGLPLVLRIREREHRTVTPLLSLLFGRNIFRLSANIGIAGGGYAPGRKVKALRTFKTRHDRIAQAEIEGNLDDPHPEVREEAVLALGRIGDAGAVETLLGLVRDKDAGLRRVAVRALGMIKDQRAVEPLLELLKEESEEIQEAAAEALGEIGGPASKSVLTDVLKSGRQVDRVLVKSAEAVSKFGDLAALWNIYPRMHETHNTVLRHQLAIAAGNLLGRPGEFYEILSKARASTNGVWTRMIRRSVKHVRRWAERSVGEQGLEQRMVNAKRREMVSVLNSLPTKIEDEDWASAIRDLRSVVRDLGLFVLGDLPGSDADDIAFLAYPRYGIGVWFTAAVERRLEETDLDEGLVMIDCLLSLYFLSRFAPEVPMSQE
ncbi:MAG: MFS transporter, partial [Phycisphaerae bacterium]|nr:MFS transporter [Phycisphaerae bacterium]